MNLSVVSAWYNEELIAPFFLNHYIRDMKADKVIIVLDQDTNDNTIEILSMYKEVEVVDFKYPDGFDDQIKTRKLSEMYRTIVDGWCIVVDSDEFVFSLDRDFKNDYLIKIDQAGYTLVRCNLINPYRNILESDLDPDIEIIPQRRYGTLRSIWGSETDYIKPIVAKAGYNFEWGIGQHYINTNPDIIEDPQYVEGVHWQYADPSIVLQRHTRNRIGRNGPANKALNLSFHFETYTEDNVLAECEKHLHDERIF